MVSCFKNHVAIVESYNATKQTLSAGGFTKLKATRYLFKTKTIGIGASWNGKKFYGYIYSPIEFEEDYLDDRYNRECHYSKTVGEFIEEYPIGTYLITMPNHITVVKDGVIYDTFDCSNRNMWCCWRVE